MRTAEKARTSTETSRDFIRSVYTVTEQICVKLRKTTKTKSLPKCPFTLVYADPQSYAKLRKCRFCNFESSALNRTQPPFLVAILTALDLAREWKPAQAHRVETSVR
jgi:hypothetical protein